jgi:hypothetical protein
MELKDAIPKAPKMEMINDARTNTVTINDRRIWLLPLHELYHALGHLHRVEPAEFG